MERPDNLSKSAILNNRARQYAAAAIAVTTSGDVCGADTIKESDDDKASI
jgi:hypothetical protein